MACQRRYQVLLTEPTWRSKLAAEAKGLLETIAAITIEENLTHEQLVHIIGGYDAVLADERVTYDSNVFQASNGRLKIVSIVGEGYENVDLDSASRHGIMVTNTPGTLSLSVAEHVVGLLLAAARDLPLWDKELREGIWDHTARCGIELWGKTHGQIGLGKTGFLVARALASAFRMRIVVYDPLQSWTRVAGVGGKAVPLETLLRESDTVALNVPLTEETYHLIGAQELHCMKRTAILINVSRGDVVDEDALVGALQRGEIGKAALDVFHEEPLQEGNPLVGLSNVVLTPHVAWNTDDAAKQTFTAAAGNAVTALRGVAPRSVLNAQGQRRLGHA